MNASTALARAVVEALAGGGVTDVVLCPGSRSAPLAYALHAADAGGRLRLHVRHDERAAAFTALGVGRGGGLGAVVTTSGTAVANLHPAVLEASEAGVPLLVVSADRPHALRGSWANQTTALQAGLFGAAVRLALDLPVPAPSAPLARAVATWRAGVRDAVAASRGLLRPAAAGRPGPVHLDLAFDDPLVPDDATPPATAPATPTGPAPGTAGDAEATAAVLDRLLAELGPGPVQTVVVAGDGAGPLARALAESCGWPLLAEPSSGARSGPHAVGPYRLLLGRAELGGAVRRAVVLGRPTLSRPVSRLLGRDDVEVVQVVRHRDDPRPPRPVRRVVLPTTTTTGPAPTPRTGEPAGAAGQWLAVWQRAGAAAQGAVEAVLDAEAAAGRLTGPFVARQVAAAAAPDQVLVAAASNPVRDLDLAARPWPDRAPAVLSNRGLAGIDGTLSTASGVALATGAGVRVLVGDLALLHDANGLLLPPGETEPDLAVVVVNDDGGGIFTGLEHGEPQRAATFERLFGTPHGADLGALCRALGVRHDRAPDAAGLQELLERPVRGRSVVEVRTDRALLRDLHARIAAAVADAVGAAVG